MSLKVITSSYAALPSDMRRAHEVDPGEGAYQLPVTVTDMSLYRYEQCDVCDRPVREHVWVALDVTDTDTMVLRCSNDEGS